MAAKMPMMTTTISNSIKVKPLRLNMCCLQEKRRCEHYGLPGWLFCNLRAKLGGFR